MRINYNVTGADRKALVRAMVELLGEPPVYQGAPSFAYAVGGYRVDKDGMVSVPEDTARKTSANWWTPCGRKASSR